MLSKWVHQPIPNEFGGKDFGWEVKKLCPPWCDCAESSGDISAPKDLARSIWRCCRQTVLTEQISNNLMVAGSGNSM